MSVKRFHAFEEYEEYKEFLKGIAWESIEDIVYHSSGNDHKEYWIDIIWSDECMIVDQTEYENQLTQITLP